MRSAPAARPVRHCVRRPRGWQDPDPKMAAPSEVDAPASGEGNAVGCCFGSWLDGRLESLGVDRAVYGAYILGVLQEEEEEEKLDALQGILSAFLVRSPNSFLASPCQCFVSPSPYRNPRGWVGVTGRGMLFLSSGPWGRRLVPIQGLGNQEGYRSLEEWLSLLLGTRLSRMPVGEYSEGVEMSKSEFYHKHLTTSFIPIR